MSTFIDSTLRPDQHDPRDYIFAANTNSLPTSVDLRPHAGEIENQLNTGSCVANATVSALEIILQKGGKFFDLSRLFLYYNLREPYENLHGKDIGSYLRDGFKFVNKLGICSENTWQFIPSQVNTKPSQTAYDEALNHRVTKYERIDGFNVWTGGTAHGILLMKAALSKGFPVTISMKLGKTFYELKNQKDLTKHKYTGLNNDSIGGHAMCVVGFDDSLDGFIVENSWGREWGDNGYCLISYDVIVKDCNDVWVCSGFDGIELNPDWIDPSPNLIVEPQEILIYKGEPLTVHPEVNMTSGTPPYNFKWNHVINHTGSGNFQGSSSILREQKTTFKMNEGKTLAKIYCDVQDSSFLKKKAVCNVTIKVLDEERPVEPEPVEPKPVEPKKKDDKTKIIIGGIVVIVIGLIIYFN